MNESELDQPVSEIIIANAEKVIQYIGVNR